MGVPKFFRWLSERYPKIIQRHGSRPVPERIEEHFGELNNDVSPAIYIPPPDPLSECGIPPTIDRLYIDVNGILHGCSHNNSNDPDEEKEENKNAFGEGHKSNSNPSTTPMTEEQIFTNICYYLDRIVRDVAKPQELLYLAIDGVAPRAKLNQQRARRYMSGQEGAIQRTIYDAHQEKVQREIEDLRQENRFSFEDKREIGTSSNVTSSSIVEVEEGRFVGKFESSPLSDSDGNGLPSSSNDTHEQAAPFHSNTITPGTPFFQRCTEHILKFIERKVQEDPQWGKLKIIFSGPNVPGEGEHKIMQFIREQRMRSDYDPNYRHCIMGQDGDLIMLGLATHEPNLFLLREQVVFDRRREKHEPLLQKYGVKMYIHNANFEFLHMNVLRDYLAFEFETSNVLPGESPFDLERTIDDFVFMTFLVGNDFLPHIPAIDIGDEAFELIFHAYQKQRKYWLKDESLEPYLTYAGNIISGKRLEGFLTQLGKFEKTYYMNKKEDQDLDRDRKLESKYGRKTTPDDDILVSKEESDRLKFRELLEDNEASVQSGFRPVLSKIFRPSRKGNEPDEETYRKMGLALRYSAGAVDDRDLKGRYYADKLGFSPFDEEKHIRLRKAYVEGLVWNLKYYFEGCPSWEWFYPYHYGPMLSDLVDLDNLLATVNFDDKIGSPLKPYEQLLACLPPSQATFLPGPYRWLMNDESSPIRDFYPASFVIDMNGKRWPWEAVVLLPFIESKRLIDAASMVSENALTEDEKRRNSFGVPLLISREPENLKKSVDSRSGVSTIPFESSSLAYTSSEKPVLYPELKQGVQFPLPGLPSLRDGNVHSLFRKFVYLNVHGSPSRYKTAVLEINNEFPELHSIEAVATVMIGDTVYVNYPHLIEGIVTAVSDSSHSIRGQGNSKVSKVFSTQERISRQARLVRLLKNYMAGEKVPGTGGLTIAGGQGQLESFEILMNVRPMKGLKELQDGTVCKIYADFEIEVPLFVASWKPMNFDIRLLETPKLLEKDPYKPHRILPLSHFQVGPKPSPTGQSVFGLNTGVKPTESLARGISTFAFRHGSSPRCFTALATKTPIFSRNMKSFSFGLKARKTASVLGICLAVAFFSGAQASDFALPSCPVPSLVPSIPSSNSHRIIPGLAELPHPTSNDIRSMIPESELDVPIQPPKHPGLEFAHGTTTLAFVFDGGIICAVDSRASLGNFVGSKTTQKVLPIHSHLLGTMAGGAADCMFWIRKLSGEAALHELMQGRRMSVGRASRLLSNALFENRGLDLSVGTMIMGFDDVDESMVESVPRLYYVDNTGMRIEGDMFSVGSGSTFALGILDTEWRADLSVDDAIALGIKAIRYATFRDAFSGGFINVYLVTKDGWKRVFREDVAALKSDLK